MEEEYSMIRYIKRRIINNKNFLCTITGPTGSGKTWTALSIAKRLDPEFKVDRIIFKGRELMKLINDGDLKPGSVIVWDEAGIDLSNRNWQSVTNKMLNALLQTFRHRNFILFFTVPYNDFIDLATRKLFHADFETQHINKGEQTVTIKPKLLQYNSNMGKWYRKYLKVNHRGKITKIKRWDIPKPDDELVKEYEMKRTMFTKNLNKEIDKQLASLEEPEEGENKIEISIEQDTVMKNINSIDEKIWMLYQEGKSYRQICKEVGYKSPQTIMSRINMMKEKKELIDSYKLAIKQQSVPTNLTS
jgi:ABC-type dipeptide/oligopeptide/nickel transport system ATPase component